MPQQASDSFLEQYAQLHDDELIRLSAEAAALVPEARAALQSIMSGRKISLPSQEAEQQEGIGKCVGCGAVLLSEAAFCSRCGKRTKPASPRTLRWQYIALSVILTFLVLLLVAPASALVSVVLSLLLGLPGRGPDAVSSVLAVPLLFWLLLLAFAKVLWRSIEQRERRDILESRHKELKRSVCIGLVAVMLIGGILAGLNARQAQRAPNGERAAADLEAKQAEFGRRLHEIRYRRANSYEEYYKQCADMEQLIKEYAPVRQEFRRIALGAYATTGSDKEARMAASVRAFFEKDDSILADYQKEITYSRTIVTLPPRIQRSFYESNIVPLQQEETRLAAEELKVLQHIR
jgi:hypothetical protein